MIQDRGWCRVGRWGCTAVLAVSAWTLGCAAGSGGLAIPEPPAVSAGGPALSPFDLLIRELLGTGGSGGLDASSEEGTLARYHRGVERLARLEAVDTTALGEEERVEWLVARSMFQQDTAEALRREWRRNPSGYLPFNPIYTPLASETPLSPQAWGQVHRALEQFTNRMAVARERLEAPPPLWVAMAEQTTASMRRFLEGELPRRLVEAPDTLRPRLAAAAAAAVGGIDEYVAFLRSIPHGEEGSWASGAGHYDFLLREVHQLPYDAEGLIALGWRLHGETKAKLDSLAAVHHPSGDWRVWAAEASLRHPGPGPGEVRAAYERESRRAKAHIIEHDLLDIPPCEELIFIDTPPQLRATYAYGGYSSASPVDAVAVGRFFVTPVEPGMTEDEVASKLRGHNHGWITVVAIHEGYPGHHLQRVKSFQNPRTVRHRFSNPYFSEGWALYAEDLMRRAGFYRETDALLTQLRMRLWRTARVIVDPSLHTGRMTDQEAVDFLVDEVGLEPADARAEVNRYTTWPTQAPSYVVGWVEIERIRAEIEAVRGADFDEREFHERLLTVGSLPLALVRRSMAAWYPELNAAARADPAGGRP